MGKEKIKERSLSASEAARRDQREGIQDSIPIALGYFAVSFTFGIMGSLNGLAWWETTLISVTNVTSAGQFAGLSIMSSMGSFIEMAMTQFVVNLRYSLMSISLSQKVDEKFRGIWRALLGFFMTDEIFAVAASKDRPVTRRYFAFLSLLPVACWTLGTMCGAILGDILPAIVTTSLGISLYGMFIAIVVPPAREHKPVLMVVLLSVAISCLLHYGPMFQQVSSGFAVIICAVIASAAGALLFPVPEEGGEA